MTEPFIPRPYQTLAIDHILTHPRCALHIDMGMGKTASVLAALLRLNYVQDVFPALVVAPLRVARDTWPDEVKKWNEFRNLKIVPVLGTADQRLAALKKEAHIFTINYENLEWLIDLYGKKWPFRTVIIDESTKVKTARVQQGGVRASALYKVCNLPIVSILIELTGLAAPNGLADLFGQMLFLDNGFRLGRSFDAFKQRWFVPDWDGYGMNPLPHAQEEIQEKIKDLCLAINAEDWFDLKKPIEVPVYVTLPPAAWKHYKEMEREMFTVIDREGIEAVNAGAKRIKCMQIADGLAYYGETGEFKEVHNEKIKALESIVEESAGMPLLCAYHFKGDLKRLTKAFKGSEDISKSKGFSNFKSGKVPLGLAHPASLGHGVDSLQYVTNRIAYFSHNDNYDDYKQMLGRIGPVRQFQAGFDRPVFVYDIIAKDTVEDYAVVPNLKGKGELNDLLKQAMKRIKS